ncbi:hypothetical protein MalM25_30870 [Planctomycetes bacterium MalM25]|nr:hypothetical protein MalM25_30870 [Planctomycetes bacterium MalM25]
MNRKMKTWMLAAIAALSPAAVMAQGVTINFSSLEVVLAEPDNKMSIMSASWAPWSTQLKEYNMPFIEVLNPADSLNTLESFQMSIGDTNYNFSNEYYGKNKTNSAPFPADGTWAIKGYSTPDIAITSSVQINGDQLLVSFDEGLKPGEVVRFQVDINPDDPDDSNQAVLADYTSVFFNNEEEGEDPVPNSEIRIEYTDSDQFALLTLPDVGLDFDPQSPRPYTVMQPIPTFPDVTIPGVPEPTTALLASLAIVAGASRRRV